MGLHFHAHKESLAIFGGGGGGVGGTVGGLAAHDRIFG